MRPRTKISKKNPYWVSRHRFLELYHFSLQYNDWLREIASTAYLPAEPEFDPTGEIGVKLTKLTSDCMLVKQCCMEADIELWKYIFKGVTEGVSYDTLRSKYHIPCGKDYYFTRWRKYFWLLSNRK